MKQFTQLVTRSLLSIAILFMSAIAFAQDKTVDININTKSNGNWYAQPWVWIVGAAVFILLLVALTRSGSKSEA